MKPLSSVGENTSLQGTTCDVDAVDDIEAVDARGDWALPHKVRAGFDELVDWLNSEATALRKRHSELLGLSVIGVDLIKREKRRPAKTIEIKSFIAASAVFR